MSSSSAAWETRWGGESVRHRVLLEDPDGNKACRSLQLLKEHGYEASWCRGPQGPPPHRCPLLALGRYEQVPRADVVVSSLEPRHMFPGRSSSPSGASIRRHR